LGLPLLQRLTDGKPARNPTRQEFMDVLKRVKAAAHTAHILQPFFCFDKPKVHQNLDYEYIGINEALQVWEQPTMSGDFNQVVEHFHSYAVHAFQEELAGKTDMNTPKQYARLFKCVAKRVATSEVVAKDVSRLPAFYEEVIKKCGGWPAKRFR
jgi:hypothetical protein